MHRSQTSSAYLLPWHGHVLQELQHGVGHELECTQIHGLVVTELAVRHVSVVGDDLADVLWRHVLLLRLNEAWQSANETSKGAKA